VSHFGPSVDPAQLGRLVIVSNAGFYTVHRLNVGFHMVWQLQACRLPPKIARRIAYHIAKATDHLHQKPMLHRCVLMIMMMMMMMMVMVMMMMMMRDDHDHDTYHHEQ
jgi:hypothetical protein